MSEKVTLLLDSDIIAYKFASTAQKNFDWNGDGQVVSDVRGIEEVTPEVAAYIEEWKQKAGADEVIVCLSCPTAENFRYGILPSYKHNRVDTGKPVLLNPIKDWMRVMYPVFERPTLEADDVMGILSTHQFLVEGKKIIFSEDKDMKTIPGWLLNPTKDTKPRYISEDQADYFHLYQTLVGDTTDGYKGCPGVGPVKAEKILAVECSFYAVVLAFESKGLPREDALVQARVARICRFTDYDFTIKEVRPWLPK